MADTLTTTLSLQLSWLYRNALDLTTVKDDAVLQIEDDLADGTAVDQADVMFSDQRTLSASSNDDLDLAASLTNSFGATITFAKIKAVLIRLRTTDASAGLEVGAGSNPFITWLKATGDGIKIGPGGVFFLWNPSAAGYAVTASTGDILRITNSGSVSATYDIVLIGTTA